MERKGIRSLLAAVLCLGLATGCIFLEAFVENRLQKMEADQNAGLNHQRNETEVETGQTLSEVILYEDEEIVCYEDRILCRFFYQEENTTRTAAMVKGMLDNCPALEHVYVLPVPYLVFLEEGYEEDKEAYLTYMEQLSLKLPEKAVLVDTLPVLEEHKNEYVFFRTEDAWTARGAYYGTEVLCDVLGLEQIPFEQYREYMYASFRGGLTLKDNLDFTQELEELQDQTYYYLLPDSVNMAEVMMEDSSGKKVSYKKPVVTSSARNLGSFIDSIHSRAIVEGEHRNAKKEGKYVLIVCDSAGRLLVPYLKDYYDGVYVINIRQDKEFYHDLCEIVEEYHISEVIFAQNAMEMGVPGYSRALNDFYRSDGSYE